MVAVHKGTLVIAMALAFAVGDDTAAWADPEPVTISIASGQTGGLYYPVAGAICKLVNENTDAHGITCTVEFGEGSVGNIEAMREGKVSMAMAQADSQRDAVEGVGPFEEEGAYADLRSMFALFVENVTVLARKDKDIASFEDLEGKRLYLPDAGSGVRALMEQLIEAEGWDADAIEVVTEHEAPNLAQALCSNEFDAFAIIVAHPSPLITEATNSCDAVLVPVAGSPVEEVVADDPMYPKSSIAGDTYRGNDQDVETIGLVATLVTSTETDARIVYHVTKSFFEGLDRLKQESDLFAALTPEQLVQVGLTAPLHEGASQYFREAGLQ